MDLHWKKCGQIINSAVTASKLLLHRCVNLKRKKKKYTTKRRNVVYCIIF